MRIYYQGKDIIHGKIFMSFTIDSHFVLHSDNYNHYNKMPTKTNPEPDDKHKREKAKKIAIIEGSFSSVMDGFGQRYITPYALALGASNFVIGLLSSLPQLLGNLSQLPVIKLMKNKKRKNIIMASVFTQAFLWLPIILVGFFYFYLKISSALAASLLIIFYTLMIIAGATAGPVWNSLMKDIVKENQGEYFGKRSRITGFIGILSMIIAGVILNYFGKDNFLGFFIILLIACIGRFCSGYMFTRQYEPEFKYDEGYYFSPIEFIKKMSSNNFGRFVILVSGISFATAIAAPFFAVYMLRDLNFSYIDFTLVTLSAPLATLLFVPVWGKFADKFGNLKVLKITGYLIPLIPVYWLGTLLIIPFNSKILLVTYLFICEIISGFAWSGFNLCSVNFIYDAVTRQRMALCATYYNILNAFGTLFGGLLGGILASQSQIFGIKSILFVILLSGILRLLMFVITIKGVKEVRTVQDFDVNHHLRKRIKHYLGIETQEIIEVKD